MTDDRRRRRPRRGARLRGDRGVTQVAAVIVAVVALGGAGAGFAAQRVLDDDPAPAGTSAEAVRGSVLAYDCPDGAVIGEVHSGDRLFLTARSPDGDWVRTRDPLAPDVEWWIELDAVAPDRSVDALAEAGCGDDEVQTTDEGDDDGGSDVAAGDTTTSTDTVAPGETAPPGTVIIQTPQGPQAVPAPGGSTGGGSSGGSSGGSTGGGSTGTPTSPPDTTGPALTIAPLAPNDLYESDGGGVSCGALPRQATLSATVSDPSGVAEVRATWTAGSYNGNKVLAGGGVRTTTIGPHPYHAITTQSQQVVTVTVRATDTRGNQTVQTTTFVLHSADQCFI